MDEDFKTLIDINAGRFKIKTILEIRSCIINSLNDEKNQDGGRKNCDQNIPSMK